MLGLHDCMQWMPQDELLQVRCISIMCMLLYKVHHATL